MKAVVVTQFGAPDVLNVVEADIPSIESHQVLIRVAGTSVNFADIKARRGGKKASGTPFVLGLDAAGVIEQVGADVHTFKVGQRVIAFPKGGSYAQYVVADEALTFALPDAIDFDVAAACPIVSFTAYKLLVDVARMAPGETVLVHAAAGGVGTTAVQLAKLLGASRVIGVVGREEKVPIAMAAGADEVICTHQADFAPSVLKMTGGRGVDVILDSIAGRVSEESLRCLAMYGRLVHFGNASGEIGQFQTNELHASCRSVLGFSLGTTRKERPELLRSTAEQVLAYLADGRLKIKIGHRFDLEDAMEAHRLVESRQSVGKVLLHVRH